MAILDRDRKKLWAKSGNLCAICKTELFSQEGKEDGSNIGEECHIISGKEKGPRFRTGIENYDTYNNLVLLCRNHHRDIDELPETYTEEILQSIKVNHERWIKSKLNQKKDNELRLLCRITTGKELLNILTNSFGLRVDTETPNSKEEAVYLGGLSHDLMEYLEFLDISEPYDKVQVCFYLDKLLKDLESKNYFLFGERKLEPFRSSKNDKDNIPISTILIRRNKSPEILKFNIEDFLNQ